MEFYLGEETLYKKSSDETLLRCLEKKSGEEIYEKRFDLLIWFTRKQLYLTMPITSMAKIIIELYPRWKIKHSNSSPYRPKMNVAVEIANKNVKKIIQKMIFTYKD